ncbi:MAG: cytochrome c maturation protein CcmE [Actinomycetota bacterium]
MTATNPTQPAVSRPARVAARHRGRNITAMAVIAGAVVFLLVKGITGSLNFYKTVNEALKDHSSLGTSTFRLEGVVKPGSIVATASGARFTLIEGSHTIDVVNSGTPPQLFQGNIPVVVSGHFVSKTSSDFVSNEILVKHSSTYIEDHPDRVKAQNGTVR